MAMGSAVELSQMFPFQSDFREQVSHSESLHCHHLQLKRVGCTGKGAGYIRKGWASIDMQGSIRSM